ncbi:hypothetical protein RUM44_009300 [Polyplax serrata]|uniref:Uncharacterized protein n=1 Tax=Polyplax serrata TaxID=468196 RepID=A0ABR1ASJ1_POLSC
MLRVVLFTVLAAAPLIISTRIQLDFKYFDLTGSYLTSAVVHQFFSHTAITGTTLLNSHALTLSLYKPFESAEDDGDLTDLRLGNWDYLCKLICGNGNDYFDWIRSVDEKGIQPRIFCNLCEKKIQTTTAKSTTTTTTQKPSSTTPSTSTTPQPVTNSIASGDNTSTASTSA